MTERELRSEVEQLARTHAWDVAGNFDPRVYSVATRLMPPVLGALVDGVAERIDRRAEPDHDAAVVFQ